MTTKKHTSTIIGLVLLALWIAGIWWVPMAAKSTYVIATLLGIAVWQAMDAENKRKKD